MLQLILMGAPGSGKGTQAERLVSHFHIPHISTGEMLREAVEGGTDLGAVVEVYMSAGRLVPDHHVIRLVEDRLTQSDPASGFVLDGFPRTLKQANAFDELMESKGTALDCVVLLDVPEDALVARMSSRRVDPETGRSYNLNVEAERPPSDILWRLEQRHDDVEEVIRQRLATYHEETDPAIEHYAGLGQLVRVDGRGDPDVVFYVLRRRLESVEQGS